MRISNLPPATSINDEDIVPVVQNGKTKKLPKGVLKIPTNLSMKDNKLFLTLDEELLGEGIELDFVAKENGKGLSTNDFTDEYKELVETNKQMCNATQIILTEFDQYYVNLGVLYSNISTSKGQSAIVKAVKDATYKFTAKGKSFNRFRVFGGDSIATGTAVTEIYRAANENSVENSFEFVNTAGYTYIIVFLDYNTTDFNCELTIYSQNGENASINGVSYLTKEQTEKLIETEVVGESKQLEKKYFSANNLFDLNKATDGKMIAYDTGIEYGTAQYLTSDFIEVEPNQEYILSVCYSVCYFDDNKSVIPGAKYDARNVQITTPANARYLRFCCANVNQYIQLNKGTELLPYDDGQPKLNPKYYDGNGSIKYALECETVKVTNGFSSTQNLTLISAKIVYGSKPEYQSYLFYNSEDNGLYCGDCMLNNVTRLCDWNTAISNGVGCYEYLATITADGDIVFLRKFIRENPIIYPHGDYNNPVRVDFGSDLKPYGFLTSVSVVHFADGSFVFGDYTTHKESDEVNNDPRCIWRVTKPYTNHENWTVAKRFKHVYYNHPASNEPNNEIGHIHTMSYDFYSDTLYCSTGDIDRHCRVLKSKDKGRTWTQVAVGADNSSMTMTGEGQKYRSVGMIFTKDACYYGTDSFYTNHNLWKAPRDAYGEVDFVNITKICSLEPANRGADQSQATYGTILLRNPNGLLFLERAEPRADHKLDILFYSFDDESLYTVATFNKVIFGWEVDERNGLCNQCFTEYQPTTTDFVMCGGGTSIRPNQTDILNNAEDNYIGTVKMKIVALGSGENSGTSSGNTDMSKIEALIDESGVLDYDFT